MNLTIKTRNLTDEQGRKVTQVWIVGYDHMVAVGLNTGLKRGEHVVQVQVTDSALDRFSSITWPFETTWQNVVPTRTLERLA